MPRAISQFLNPSAWVGAGLLLLGSISCNREAPPPEMPPLPVDVNHPIEREVTNYLYYNGVTKGFLEYEVRPRVAGYLQKVNFRPDSQVKEGDLLFSIDQQPYKVAVQRAEADLAGKRATVASTNANLERTKKLVAQQAASDQELIERTAAFELALAEVGVAEAALQQAKDELGYTEIRAESPGRISRNLVDKGTLVRVNEPVLATVVNDDKIYVDFNVSEAEFLDYLRRHPKARTANPDENEPVVIELGMSDEAGFPHVGRVVSGDNKVNTATGTYGVRAEFNNPDKQIAPGLFVRVRTVMEKVPALLVADVAVQADPRGQFVYIVNDKNVVERRAVITGVQVGPFRRIISGVTPADRVIINGLMMVRPEAPVTPTVTEPPALPPSPSTSPSAVLTTQPTTKPTGTPSTQPTTEPASR